jgi:hypothetical protein
MNIYIDVIYSTSSANRKTPLGSVSITRSLQHALHWMERKMHMYIRGPQMFSSGKVFRRDQGDHNKPSSKPFKGGAVKSLTAARRTHSRSIGVLTIELDPCPGLLLPTAQRKNPRASEYAMAMRQPERTKPCSIRWSFLDPVCPCSLLMACLSQ